MRHATPRRLTLPFGFIIRIRQVTMREMAKAVGDDACAGWISDNRTIYLTRSRTTKQKRADLAHELIHAVVDYGSYLLTMRISTL